MGLNWKYNGEDFTEDLIGNNYGFVYEIVNLTNNKKYIGKKFFYSTKTKQVKGKKKKYKVPEILLSGHRAKIDEWKKKTNIDKK